MSEHFYGKADIVKVGKIMQHQPEIFQKMMELSTKVMAEGALSTKVKELIAVACAHITQCPYCISGHVKAAKAAGVTEAELTEAILVAVSLASGASMAHASVAFKAFED